MQANSGNIILIGMPGSGKSTFLRLLMRFWDVSSGTIRIGERDIRTVNTARATPCAWFPAEQAITPFSLSSLESWLIL